MPGSDGRAAPISAVNDGRSVFVRHTRCQAISDCEFKACPDGDPWWRERTREQGERQLAPFDAPIPGRTSPTIVPRESGLRPPDSRGRSPHRLHLQTILKKTATLPSRFLCKGVAA